jgi:hypothetical protein
MWLCSTVKNVLFQFVQVSHFNMCKSIISICASLSFQYVQVSHFNMCKSLISICASLSFQYVQVSHSYCSCVIWPRTFQDSTLLKFRKATAILTHSDVFFPVALRPPVDYDLLILEVSRSHTITQ